MPEMPELKFIWGNIFVFHFNPFFSFQKTKDIETQEKNNIQDDNKIQPAAFNCGIGFWGKNEDKKCMEWGHFNQAAKIINMVKVGTWGQALFLF